MHASAGVWLAVDREDAVERREAVGEAAQARAGRCVRTADAVVLDIHEQPVADRGDAHGRLRRLRILGDIRECLGDDVVRRRLHGLRVAVRRQRQLHGQRRAIGENANRGGEPALRQRHGVDPASELS